MHLGATECRIPYLYLPEGYSDIFMHTRARVIFGVQNFEFLYFWGFQKKKIGGGGGGGGGG